MRSVLLNEGLSFTDELVARIVSDLLKEGQIRPPELQIVCTALTANFTLRNYNKLGGAKGILESYLTLTLETCIDQQLARLVLRQMCDFEKHAKAEAKTAAEFAQAIGPQKDDSGATARIVQLVLDHLVHSRLAVTVNGKVSLIHDYWVSVIQGITAHDKSEREKADELLRGHLYEMEAGFSSTLSSKQLRLVRRFSNRDLLNTREATRLLRKSAFRLWAFRSIMVGIALIVLFLALGRNAAWAGYDVGRAPQPHTLRSSLCFKGCWTSCNLARRIGDLRGVLPYLSGAAETVNVWLLYR